jgi:hypothetical protein
LQPASSRQNATRTATPTPGATVRQIAMDLYLTVVCSPKNAGGG